MEKAYVSNLTKGDIFKLSATETAPIWVRGDYDRSSKTYSCYQWEDVNRETFLKATRRVYTGFTF